MLRNHTPKILENKAQIANETTHPLGQEQRDELLHTVVKCMANHLAPPLDNRLDLGGRCSTYSEPLVPTNPQP